MQDFGEINPGGIPAWMRGAQHARQGVKDTFDLANISSDMITKALQHQKMQQELPYIQKMKEQELQQAILANKINEARAKYADPREQASLQTAMQHNQFDPRIWESEIASRQANTNKTNIMTPLEAQELKIKNQFQPELMKSQAEMYRMGGRGGAGVGQKERMELRNQLHLEHPEWSEDQVHEAASAALSGGNTFSTGEKIPGLSGEAQSIVAQIQKRNSNAALQTQAANMDILSNDINDIDITPISKFTGIKGKMDIAKYSADMTMGREVPQDFRDYLSFKNITSNCAMDALRKGFGTSVVPGYVYATLGNAANPTSTWWHDPKQVINDWNKTKEWINTNSKRLNVKATQGISAKSVSDKVSEKMSKSNSNENDPFGIL